MTEKNGYLSPVLKWAGGKRQLLSRILPMIPFHDVYYEPFVGGGAVLFGRQPERAVINDRNPELINVYHVIKEEPEALLGLLREHEAKNGAEYFYRVRELDRDPESYGRMTDAERAARVIYLNRTCYNGLFRVNRAGQFNVPYGRYKHPDIVNESVIRDLHRYFQTADLVMACGDYREVLHGISSRDFVYFDPPYMPISPSSSFTGYTAGGFGEAEQVQLKETCDVLNEKGVKFLLSNSACPFIEDLYRDYIVDHVSAKRSVGADGKNRGAVTEVLVHNYELDY